MSLPKKLIEVAIPVKEISAESVRDKSIRHGHISTLHLWWARRPLPVCRAVVFASLVPDPLDPHCPQAFRDAVELLLGKAHNPGDPYRPYADIPWTAVYDPMEDNLRNRLQMFIGRFSPEAEQAMLLKKPTPPAGKMLSDFSLIKWDNKNNEEIINKARKLIWVAYNSNPDPSPTEREYAAHALQSAQGNNQPAHLGYQGNVIFKTDPQRWKYLKDFVRANRKNPTPSEKIIWEALRDKRFHGIKFRRQHAIEDFIADFASLEYRLIIEIDGEIHDTQQEYDQYRTEYLQACGYQVVRFSNDAVKHNLPLVLKQLWEKIQQIQQIQQTSEKTAPSSTAPVTSPLPTGEGPGVGFGSAGQPASVINSQPGSVFELEPRSKSAAELLLADFDRHYAAIKTAEHELYSLPDRHLPSPEVQAKEAALHQAIEAFLDRMPRVFDPFAGGGAIPLEAARLGCRAYGNDINPVAHIIQKGSLEFPQKYGKPITYSKAEFIARYGQASWDAQPNENKTYQHGDATAVRIPNRLAFDVDFYARELLRRAEAEIGHYYPANEKGNKPIAYYWVRVGTCSNPSCRAEVPLLKGFYLCNKPDKKVYLKPVIEGNKIEFDIKNGKIEEEGWIARGNLQCPCCRNSTEVNILKQQFWAGTTKKRLLCVIWESDKGRLYLPPSQIDLNAFQNIQKSKHIPNEPLPVTYSKAMAFCGWNFNTWGDLFEKRELLAINTLEAALSGIEIKANNEYEVSVKTYLSILLNRLVSRMTTFGLLNANAETIEHPFGKSAIQMVFDYPEVNPFSTSGGGGLSQLDWIERYIEGESDSFNYTVAINAASGDRNQFPNKFLTAVITDPPYYDAVAYADLSDFFYVWMKRVLVKDYPLIFATPLTPKKEECTALKHHREESNEKAKIHFEQKLLEIFSAIQVQTSEVVSIMYAHQSTEAWTTLCNSILGASMNITGSWAIDTERSAAGLKKGQAFLSSSVTISCRPAQRQGIGDYKTVKKAIEERVAREVEHLYTLGFRGADLLTACFGQAVSEFGQYQAVEKADGSRVTVADLLEMARESAFNALLKGFQGDDFTKFYIAWLQLYGFTESDFDDAAKFSRVGLTINVQDLFREHILLKNGNKQALGDFQARLAADKKLGESEQDILINKVHRALHLYRGANRGELLRYLARVADQPTDAFWRVLTSLCEVLPAGSEDLKQAQGLLTNRDSLLRECREMDREKPTQTQLDL